MYGLHTIPVFGIIFFSHFSHFSHFSRKKGPIFRFFAKKTKCEKNGSSTLRADILTLKARASNFQPLFYTYVSDVQQVQCCVMLSFLNASCIKVILNRLYGTVRGDYRISELTFYSLNLACSHGDVT